MVHDIIKTFVENHDIKSLKYSFVDCLDVDPTFEEYKDDYDYCINRPELGLFEEYIELTPMREDKNSWDISYWNSIKIDLIKNFSQKRFQHMRKVAQVVHADKIRRFTENEREHIEAEQKRLAHENRREKITETSQRKEQVANNIQEKKSSEIERERIEEERREFARKQRTKEEAEEKEWSKQVERRTMKEVEQKQEDMRGKKAVGIVVAVLIIAVVCILLIRGI